MAGIPSACFCAVNYLFRVLRSSVVYCIYHDVHEVTIFTAFYLNSSPIYLFIHLSTNRTIREYVKHTRAWLKRLMSGIRIKACAL